MVCCVLLYFNKNFVFRFFILFTSTCSFFCVFVALTARESTLLTLSQQVVEVTEFGTTTFSSSLAQLRIIRCDSPAKENCVSNFDQSVRVKWIAIISIYRSSFRYLSIYRIGAFCQVLRNL